MESKDKDGLDQFRKWLVPILLSLITVLGGVLGSNVMEAIKNLNVKVDAINQVVTKQSVMDNDLGNVKEKVANNANNIQKLREDFDQHVMFSGDAVMQGAVKRLKRR